MFISYRLEVDAKVRARKCDYQGVSSRLWPKDGVLVTLAELLLRVLAVRKHSVNEEDIVHTLNVKGPMGEEERERRGSESSTRRFDVITR